MDSNSNKTPPCFIFITLFPETISVWLTTSILGRAREKGLFQFETLQLRDFSTDKHRSVDDAPYGGGGGMVLRLEPLVAAVESVKTRFPDARVVHFSPKGTRLNCDLIDTLAAQTKTTDYILICGHYEGIDQRFSDHWVDLEVSLGDFVLTGGELPAVAFADSMIRRISGALASDAAHEEESFSLRDENNGRRLLEYPHYTRPVEFRGHKVPEILLGGNHAAIACWRKEQSLAITSEKADPTR